MRERVRIQGGGSPLSVYASSGQQSILDLLFSGDHRSLKIAQQGTISFPATAVNFSPYDGSSMRVTDAWAGASTRVWLGKSFPNAPFYFAMATLNVPQSQTTYSPFWYMDEIKRCMRRYNEAWPCADSAQGFATISDTNSLTFIAGWSGYVSPLSGHYVVFDCDVLD